MDEQSLLLFSHEVLEAVLGLPRVDALGDEPTIRDVHNAYNTRVTPENHLTWAEFKSNLRQAWEREYVQFKGSAVAGVDNLDDVIELEQKISGRATDSRKDKVYKSLWRTINRDAIPKQRQTVRKLLDYDWKDNVNQQLFDALLRNQIYLMRLSGSVRNATFDLLNKTERDIADKIASRLKAHAGKGLTPPAIKQMEWLERYIKSVRLGSWDQVTGFWVRELSELAKSEVRTSANIVNTVSPTVLTLNLPDPRLLTKIATSNPFEGKVLKDWAASLADADSARILNAIRVGMVQGDPIDTIVKRVVGSAGSGGSDGLTELTRKQAAAVIRTAVNFVGNEARAEFIAENAEVFGGERYVATLDARTTSICRANDGKVFPVGLGPRPPIHFSCRSLRIPVLSSEALGSRPARPHTERQLIKEFSEKHDLGSWRATRAALPRGYKGLYDDFARQRIRSLTMRVPSSTNYQQWLESQPRAFQNDVLGPTRAKLFREGNLKLDQFVDSSGKDFTLKELSQKHAEAFKAAGLETYTPKTYQTFTRASASNVDWKTGTLTKTEFDAVSGYTSTSYSATNAYLRGDTRIGSGAEQRIQKEVASIDSAIGRSATKEDVKVWRYPLERGDTRSDYARQIAGLKAGDRILEKGYLSTTLAENYQHAPWDRPGGVRFEILVDKGTPALNLSKKLGPGGEFASAFHDKEFEVLFGRNSRLTVQEIVEDASGGKTYVFKMDPP